MAQIGDLVALASHVNLRDRHTREVRHSHDHAAGVCWCPSSDFKAALLVWRDVHQVAELIVPPIIWSGQAFHRVGPDVNYTAVGQRN